MHHSQAHHHTAGAAAARPQRCPTCHQPVSHQLHLLRIAGDVILDCPTCWTTTVFDQAGRVLRRAVS
jgi:hypothetical protein